MTTKTEATTHTLHVRGAVLSWATAAVTSSSQRCLSAEHGGLHLQAHQSDGDWSLGGLSCG